MPTTQWIGGSGSWNDAVNWTNGVPGPADDAIINLGSQTDTISGGGTLGTLTVEGVLGENSEPIGSLTVTGTIDARTLSSSDDILTIAPGAELQEAAEQLSVSAARTTTGDPRQNRRGKRSLEACNHFRTVTLKCCEAAEFQEIPRRHPDFCRPAPGKASRLTRTQPSLHQFHRVHAGAPDVNAREEE